MTESVMVLIPLLLTFLSILQISTGVMARAVSTNVVQGDAANIAMGSSPTSSSSINGGDVKSFPLPGGGSMTIENQLIHRPAVSPLLPGGDNFEATGIAITE